MREVWIIRRGNPGKPECVMVLLKNNPHRWKSSFCQGSHTFLVDKVIPATTWWPSPPDSLFVPAALVSNQDSLSFPSPYRCLVGMGALWTECLRAWKRGRGSCSGYKACAQDVCPVPWTGTQPMFLQGGEILAWCSRHTKGEMGLCGLAWGPGRVEMEQRADHHNLWKKRAHDSKYLTYRWIYAAQALCELGHISFCHFSESATKLVKG